MSDSFSDAPQVGGQTLHISGCVFKDELEDHLNNESSKKTLSRIYDCVIQHQSRLGSLKIDINDYQELFLQCDNKHVDTTLGIVNSYLDKKKDVAYIKENQTESKNILLQMIEAFTCELKTHGVYKDSNNKVKINEIEQLPLLYRLIIVSLIPYVSLLDGESNLVTTITRRCRDELSGSGNNDEYVRFSVDTIVLSEIVKSRRNNNIDPQEKNIHHHIDRLEVYAKDYLAGDKDKEKAALSCVQGFRKATLSHFINIDENQSCSNRIKPVISENCEALAKHRTHPICRFLFYSAIACTGIGLFYLAYQSYQFNQAGAGSSLFNTRSHRLAHQVYQSSLSLSANTPS